MILPPYKNIDSSSPRGRRMPNSEAGISTEIKVKKCNFEDISLRTRKEYHG